MKVKEGARFIAKQTIVAMLSFAALISCAPTFANTDFSYFQASTSPKTIKLVNPLYLDTTKTVKPVIKTTRQYTGEFNEADYFTSEIDDLPNTFDEDSNIIKDQPKEKIQPTNLRKNDLEINNTNPNVDNIIPANNFFAPPTCGVQENEIKNTPNNMFNIPTETKPTITSDEHTPAIEIDENLIDKTEKIYTSDNTDNTDIVLDGKIINQIYVGGLKTISPELIKGKINTRAGTLYNEEILQQDLQRIYSLGFFTEKIAIEPELTDDDKINLKFILEENIPVKDISIIGNTVISTMELMPFVTPMQDLPQNISNINTAIDKINNYYHNKGYILANVDSVDDSVTGNLIFSIQEGLIEKIIIEGNEKTKDFVIQRNIMTQPNTVYNENYLKEDLSRVYSTKIFKEVDREIYPSEENNGKYNVKVIVKEDSPNTLSLGGGIDTGLGGFGSLSYQENNFLGNGQKLKLSGILGSGILLSDASIKNRMNYQVELSFFEPYFLNADNSLSSRLYYRDLGSWQVPLAIERRLGISTTVNHKVRGYKNLNTNFTAGIEHISLSEGDRYKIAEMYKMRNLNIADRAKELTGGFFVNLAPGVRYSTLDSDEIPRNGIIADAKFIEAISLSDFKHTNGRVAGSVTKFFPVREKSSFSLTARGGVKVHGSDMPDVMAFRLGGPYSIRGFRMNGVGTGDAFIMGSAELATPLPFVDKLKWEMLHKMRLTFFVDAGKVFDGTTASILYDRPMSAISAGIGLRLYIPGVGPISVDYGIPITNPGDYGSRNGYFTFGTGGINTYGNYNGW